MKKVHRLWTEEEIEFLKDNIHLTYKEIGERINRSVSSVQKKSSELGLLEKREKYYKHIWTDEKIEYLKENYATATFEEMSLHLNKGISTIRWKGNSLGLKRKRKCYKYWTDEDVDFLKQNFESMDAEVIAQKLNKPVKSIKIKAYRLDLFKSNTKQEVAIGVKLKCTYIDRGQKKSRNIHYPTERSEKKASERAIDCLTKMMKYTDVKVVEVRKL